MVLQDVSKWIVLSFWLGMGFVIVTHAGEFSSVISAVGSTWSGLVKTIEGH